MELSQSFLHLEVPLCRLLQLLLISCVFSKLLTGASAGVGLGVIAVAAILAAAVVSVVAMVIYRARK